MLCSLNGVFISLKNAKMSDGKRLLVNVLICREGVSATGNRIGLIAAFNEWRKTHGVPIQFNINWVEEGVQQEVFDILVDEKSKDSWRFHRKWNEHNADFTIKSIPQERIEGYRQVVIAQCNDDSLHWALDRWLVNKDTKISSRLVALPQYKRLAHCIQNGCIIQLCSENEVRAHKLQEKEVEICDLKKEIEKKNVRIKEITEINNQNVERIRRLEVQVKKRRMHEEEKIPEQLSEMEKRVDERNKEIQDMARRIDFLQKQTQEKQEKIYRLEKEKEGIPKYIYDIGLKISESREVSHKYEAALNSITALNQQVMDLEERLRKDNKESAGQMLESVDQIWQGQKQEILSSLENMGEHVIECLKPHRSLDLEHHVNNPRESTNQLEDDDELNNICSLLAKGLGASWRELGRALKLSSRCLDDIEAEYGRFGNEERVWGVIDRWAKRGNPTKEGLLQAVRGIDREIILGPPMTDHHRGILQTCYPYLYEEMMDVELLFPYFRGDKILTSSQIEMILEGHGRYGKIDNLLKMLPDLGCSAFDGFVKALEQSGQERIAMKLRETESMDPSVLGSDQMMADTSNRELSEETAVKGITEGDADFACVRKTREESTSDAICLYLVFLIMMLFLI